MAGSGRGVTWQRGPLSVQEVLEGPVSFDIVTAGRAFGLSREKAYDLAAAGEFPCPVLRIGRRWIVPRAGLLKALGIEDKATGGGTAA